MQRIPSSSGNEGLSNCSCHMHVKNTELQPAQASPMPRPMRSIRSAKPLLRVAMPPPPQLPHWTDRPTAPWLCESKRMQGTSGYHPSSGTRLIAGVPRNQHQPLRRTCAACAQASSTPLADA